jgi:hypothetical protein
MITDEEVIDYMKKNFEEKSVEVIKDICRYLNHKYPKTHTSFKIDKFTIIGETYEDQVLVLDSLKEIGVKI